MELLQDILTQGLSPLTWTNAPDRWEVLPDSGLRVFVPPKTDYFRNPNGLQASDDAPFLWLPVQGNFIAQVHVQPTFTATYDAGALMVRHNETRWAKTCYEDTDFGTHAVVSVVTNGVSDDANGVDLDADDVWLQIVRVGDLLAMHYALDGRVWHMTRYFALPMPREVMVGLVAQSPVGPGTAVDFLRFTVEQRNVENLRAGI